MQVNVFMLRAANDSLPTLLVLPDDAPQMEIPQHLRAADWKYLITTISGDALIGGSARVVDQLIQRDGYVLGAAGALLTSIVPTRAVHPTPGYREPRPN